MSVDIPREFWTQRYLIYVMCDNDRDFSHTVVVTYICSCVVLAVVCCIYAKVTRTSRFRVYLLRLSIEGH